MVDLKSYFHSKYQGGEDFIKNVIIPVFGEDKYEDTYGEDILENNTDLIKKAQGTGIVKILRLGTIDIPYNPTDVFDITVSDQVQMRRNRVAVQQLIRSVMSTYSSAFMIFHYSGDDKWDWRFTFCSKQGSNQESSDSKRYTFLLGPNQSCRTAAENFKKLADKCGNIELNDIVAAFDVEALSKEFFTKYKVHYDKFCQFVYDNKDNREYFGQEFSQWEDKIIRDYVKKLLGRIVFLHFLQKKGWLGVPSCGQWGDGDTQFMKHLFVASSDEQKSDYLDKVLEPLFSDALNTQRDNDVFNLNVAGFTDTKIPYLNGGLFERDELDIPKSTFPADYFADLFEFFYEYNFTIDENDPDDAEVGIDPEMLGRIFENLLEDNKDKGAYYTPKEIVQYMCRESLVAYLTTCVIKKHGDNHKPEEEIQASVRKLLKEPEAIVPKMTKEQLEDFGSYIRNVKICDPAIGSGAFPMGLLNELVRCRASINAWATDEKGSVLSGDYAALKAEIISNNIYGVDIEKGAIDIARLRFWLSIVVDEQTPEVLPNLDYKFMQGNSLITTFNGEYVNLDTNSQQHTNVVGMKREKAKLYSLKQKYYAATGDAKYQLGIDIKDSILTLISYQLGYEIQSWYEKNSAKQLSLFPETEPRQLSFADIKEQLPAEKQKIMDVGIAIRKQLADTTRSLAERAQTDIRFFDWRIMFTEVFEGENPGFDIVIGNPPYVQLSKQPNVSEHYKKVIKETFCTSGGRQNLFIFMLHQAINITNKNGVVTYIIPNTILTQEYYKDTRELLLKHHLHTIVNYNDMEFDNAVVENVTLIITKDSPKENDVQIYSCKGKEINYVKKISTIKFKRQKGYVFNINSNDFIEKLFENATPLNELCNINQAIALKGDKSLSIKQEYSPHYYKFLDGRNIGRYSIVWGGLYLDYDVERIHSCKRKDIFECKEKLFFRRVSANLMATYDNNQYFALNTLVVITPKIKCEIKFILALFNSKLMNYVYKNNFKSTKTVFSEIQARSVGELPIKRDDAHKTEIVSIVDNILAAKKANPQADTSALEAEIDRLVYDLYGLTDDEIAIVEGTNT